LKNLEAEFLVIGSGAAGGTVARELARQNRKVVVLEKGRDWKWPIGHALAYLLLYDILRTREGVIIRRGITTGGSTVIYSGNSYDPPGWLRDEYGIDISAEVDETKEELGIRPLPEDFYRKWEGMRRLVEAAGEMGIRMTPQEKFIDSRLCRPECDSCLFGCPRGAKWTSRSFLEDAVQHGAEVITGADVKKVLINQGHATGARVGRGSREFSVYADRVILCAGGIGTPRILQASGIEKAGEGFFTDPMSILLGVSRGKGSFHEMTYTYATSDFLGEFIVGTTGATNSLFAQIARLNFASIFRTPYYRHLVGMFVKLCDSPVGKVEPGGKISKPLTGEDHERMERGIGLAREMMAKSGVRPETIQVARYIGGHPGGTAGIGRVVDRQLKTEVEGLYVCDASVLPRSAGIPLVLTLVALAKKFARDEVLGSG
jgi:choline dehydrogenase-like flavoprotein